MGLTPRRGEAREMATNNDHGVNRNESGYKTLARDRGWNPLRPQQGKGDVMNISMNMSVERPAIVQDEHLVYLDELRESGVTNMYGAAPYLEDEFDLTSKEARQVLSYWMKTFSERHPKAGVENA